MSVSVFEFQHLVALASQIVCMFVHNQAFLYTKRKKKKKKKKKKKIQPAFISSLMADSIKPLKSAPHALPGTSCNFVLLYTITD